MGPEDTPVPAPEPQPQPQKKPKVFLGVVVALAIILVIVVGVVLFANKSGPVKSGSSASSAPSVSGAPRPGGGSSLADRKSDIERAMPSDSDYPKGWKIDRTVPTSPSGESAAPAPPGSEDPVGLPPGATVAPPECASFLKDLQHIMDESDSQTSKTHILAKTVATKPGAEDSGSFASTFSGPGVTTTVSAVPNGDEIYRKLKEGSQSCPSFKFQFSRSSEGMGTSMNMEFKAVPAPAASADQVMGLHVELNFGYMIEGKEYKEQIREYRWCAILRGVMVGTESIYAKDSPDDPQQEELAKKLFVQTVQRLRDLP